MFAIKHVCLIYVCVASLPAWTALLGVGNDGHAINRRECPVPDRPRRWLCISTATDIHSVCIPRSSANEISFKTSFKIVVVDVVVAVAGAVFCIHQRNFSVIFCQKFLFIFLLSIQKEGGVNIWFFYNRGCNHNQAAPVTNSNKSRQTRQQFFWIPGGGSPTNYN